LGFDALWTRFAHGLGIEGFFKCNLWCILMKEGGNGTFRVFIRREGNDNEWQDNYFLSPWMYGRKLEMSSNFPCFVERVFNYINSLPLTLEFWVLGF
jgi:hypothetical protein